MAYIGQGIKGGTFSVLDTSSNTYNGSNVTFDLGTHVSSPAQLIVSHDGVIQKPVTDYTIATGGTQITFTTAPASGASIFITEISGAVGAPMNRDINGDELILDADADTSITADTDDQIDIRIAGTDVVNLTNSSSDLVITHAVQDKDIVFKGDDGGSAVTALTLDMSAGGDLTLGANANIVFPGTNVVSTSANTLDDYEEGAWTPACPNVTVAGSEGKYTKVGRLVTVTGYLNGTNLSSLSGSVEMRITGFPFTSTMDTTFPYFTRYLDAPTNTINTVGYYANGRTYSVFYFMTDHGAYSSAAVNAFHNTSNDLYFGVTYHAT